MLPDLRKIRSEFNSITTTLQQIASGVEFNLQESLKGARNVDRVITRIKSEQSFLDKAQKRVAGELKYKEPLREIQDLIGARVVVYYKTDVDLIVEQIKRYYNFVEQTRIVPDDVSKFGYEGLHFVCFIPNPVYSTHKSNPLIPDFFELQIKTLYQHAWSQAGHGLGYKPKASLSFEEERKLAFIAAQSWGADKMLEELIASKQLNTMSATV